MRASHRLITAVLVLSFALVACGDSGGGGEGGDGELRVSGREFEFIPTDYTVAAGAEATIVFENAGTVEHNWLILADPIRSEGDLTEDNILFRIEAAPGETNRATFRPPPPGEYQVICDIPGHLSAGMEADLTVTG